MKIKYLENELDLKMGELKSLPDNPKRKAEGGMRLKGSFKQSQPGKPLVTIITTIFNGEKYLEQTIKSIVEQTYDNLEYIVIDGGSTDGTLDILRKYNDKIAYWVSEPDKGISDAFNKGIILAEGDYINFQGSDDYLLASDVIEKMMEGLNDEWLVCGKIERVANSQEKIVLLTTDGKFSKLSLLFRMSLPHQALFTHKKFFEKYGLFDVNNKFCMDYELLLRAYKNFPEVIMKDVLVSAWRDGGVGADHTMKVYKEYYRIKMLNQVAPTAILKVIFYWSVLKYYLKKFLVKIKII